MNKVVKLLLALVMVAGLLTAIAPAASAAMPTLKGDLKGTYMFCAPGQDCAFPESWRGKAYNCLHNDDYFNGNVALGFGTGSHSYSTYQGLLLRHWYYCSADAAARPHLVVVGPGWCMVWVRYTSKFMIGGGGITPFGIETARGTVQGSKLVGNILRLSTINSTSYKLNAYLC